jgi:hypothetical protein
VPNQRAAFERPSDDVPGVPGVGMFPGVYSVGRSNGMSQVPSAMSSQTSLLVDRMLTVLRMTDA